MSEQDRPETRGQEHEIRIDAPVEAVWRAISEAEELTRWYVLDAEIEPRVGGAYKVSWGEGMDGASEIKAFDPGRRLKIEHVPVEGSPEMPAGPIAEEFLIETEAGSTVLRLVTSGIPTTDDWDWFYDGTKRGWKIFLMTLRHYLEHHAGRPRDHVVSHAALPSSCEDGWTALTGAGGLGIEAVEGLAVAGRYRAEPALGEAFGGKVLLLDPPFRLLATVDELNNALLGATIEQMGPNNVLYLSLSTYGLERQLVARLRARWSEMVTALFPHSDLGGAVEEALGSIGEAEATNA